MISTDRALQKLQVNRKLATDEEINRFVEALDYLEKNANANLLPDLFAIFTDEAHEITPLQSLLTYIETHDLNMVFQAAIASAPNMLEDAPRWATRIFRRILNHDQGLIYLKDNFPKLSTPNKEAVREILRTIPSKGYFTDIKRAALQQKVDVILSQ